MREGRNVYIVFQTLFGVKFPEERPEDEFVEIVYDNIVEDEEGNIGSDRVFNNAYHVTCPEELEAFLERHDGRVNITICQATRRPEKVNTRTGQKHVVRQRAIILDIEDPGNHKSKRKPEEVRKLISEVKEKLPENIRQAIRYEAYTGGGGQLCIALSRWLKNDGETNEIEQVYTWLKKQLSHIKFIDPTSFNYAQPQRLIGTVNVKWGVRTFFFDINENAKPLDVDEIIAYCKAEQEIEQYTATRIEENKGKIKNLREAIKEIKKRVRFSDLGITGKNYGNYSSVNCPFHKPDNKPSFVIYHNPDGDLAIDYHNDERYDVIKFYETFYCKSFIEAIKELSEKVGIRLAYNKEAKREIEKETALNNFDPYEYIKEELKIKEIVRFRIGAEYHFDFVVENRDGEEIEIKNVPLFKLFNYGWALKYIGASTGYKPAPLPSKAKEEVWGKVIDAIFDISKKAEDFDRSTIHWEVQELKQIIYEAAGTDNIEDFVLSTSRFVKFFDGGKVYVSLTALIRRTRLGAVTERITTKSLINLLRFIGAKPTRISKRINGMKYELRVWELPPGDWRGGVDIDGVDSMSTVEVSTQKPLLYQGFESVATLSTAFFEEENDDDDDPPQKGGDGENLKSSVDSVDSVDNRVRQGEDCRHYYDDIVSTDTNMVSTGSEVINYELIDDKSKDELVDDDKPEEGLVDEEFINFIFDNNLF